MSRLEDSWAAYLKTGRNMISYDSSEFLNQVFQVKQFVENLVFCIYRQLQIKNSCGKWHQ